MISLPLFSLLTDVNVLAQYGPADVLITGLTLDSREAGPGVAFCALRGTATRHAPAAVSAPVETR